MALSDLSSNEEVNEIYLIGGSQVFKSALTLPLVNSCKLIVLTRINNEYECDVFMPAVDPQIFKEVVFTSQT